MLLPSAPNALTADEVSAAGAVERMDERAWNLQEQVERGTAAQQEYEDKGMTALVAQASAAVGVCRRARVT